MEARRKTAKNLLLSIFLPVLLSSATAVAEDQVLFRDDFNDLSSWKPITFSGIDRHSTYEIQASGDGAVLVARSDASASGLISKQRFSVEYYPVIHWRWKVDNVYVKGDYRRKDGDDYPLRVYVVFEYDPESAGFGTKIAYEFARTIYGEYPPDSSINYIWANREDEKDPVPNPYTDRTVMIPLQQGPSIIGTWVEETVNVYDDYLAAFGQPPPPVASLAVMNDSDNTGESATSYLDFIEVRVK